MRRSKRFCPNCKDIELVRISRQGFLQQRLYPRFGLYPWECGQCRNIFMMKNRGVKFRKTATADSAHG